MERLFLPNERRYRDGLKHQNGTKTGSLHSKDAQSHMTPSLYQCFIVYKQSLISNKDTCQPLGVQDRNKVEIHPNDQEGVRLHVFRHFPPSANRQTRASLTFYCRSRVRTYTRSLYMWPALSPAFLYRATPSRVIGVGRVCALAARPPIRYERLCARMRRTLHGCGRWNSRLYRDILAPAGGTSG